MFIWKLINSPFRFPKIKVYLGKAKMGVPYLLPRRFVKMSWNEALEKAIKVTSNPDNYQYGEHLSKLMKSYRKGYYVTKPKLVGYDVVRLGYKYKFGSLRFEWNPMFSFVFFGLQFCITIVPNNESSYWESWLYYHKHTDKNKTTLERIQQCLKEAPQNWTVYSNGSKSEVNYYQKNLKKKWLKRL